jgi:hypothetical protein
MKSSQVGSCLHSQYRRNFTNGTFDAVCDACFVIACCGQEPARLPSINLQLDVLRPASAVDICIFSGDERCEQSIGVGHDLMRNYAYVFGQALRAGAARALVLEDDFQVEGPLLESDVGEIATFIASRDPAVYGLGNLMLPTPDTFFARHQRAARSCLMMAQACFYSAAYMQTVLDFFWNCCAGEPPADFYGVDWWPWFFKATAYRYYKPLVLQTFPPTRNQVEDWNRLAPFPRFPGQGNLTVACIQALGLDAKIQPGWRIAYWVTTYGLYLLLAMLVVWAVW